MAAIVRWVICGLFIVAIIVNNLKLKHCIRCYLFGHDTDKSLPFETYCQRCGEGKLDREGNKMLHTVQLEARATMIQILGYIFLVFLAVGIISVIVTLIIMACCSYL